MTELDEWLGKQVDLCAYAEKPRDAGTFHRLIQAHGTLRALAVDGTPRPEIQIFGAVVPKEGLATAAGLAARARALIDGWIAAVDPSALEVLARGLSADTRHDLGLPEKPPTVYVADLEVDLPVEITNLDESSPRYDHAVRDLSDLARFDGTTTKDVEVDALPFARVFPELGSFTPRLAFDATRGRLVLRAVFELTELPDEARGARLMHAIAEGTREAKMWMHAEWRSSGLGEAVHRYHVIVGNTVLGARVMPR